jgi:hypothetical protein
MDFPLIDFPSGLRAAGLAANGIGVRYGIDALQQVQRWVAPQSRKFRHRPTER